MLDTETQIDEAGRARVAADLEASVANGFSHDEALYALGTPLNQTGVSNLRRSRQEFDAMSLLGEVLTQARATVDAEDRIDYPVSMHDLRVSDAGALTGPSGLGAGMPMTKHAFTQLVGRGAFPRHSASFLSACPPDLRSLNMNRFLPVSIGRKSKPIELMLRTRKAHGRREVFATLTKWYARFDVPELCSVIERLAQEGGRAESSYDGQRFELTLVYHTDIEPEAGVVGEIFKVIVRIETADDGSSAIKVKPGVFRTLCRNMVILEHAQQQLSVTHSRQDMTDAVETAVAQALGMIDFSAKWTVSRRDRVLEGIYGNAEVEHVFGELVRQGLVHVPGCAGDAMVARLVRAWEKEPGWTKADLVNAISRAAHEEPWTNPWARSSLEEQAGRYLYNYVQLAPYHAA
jgi:hypothetical protein